MRRAPDFPGRLIARRSSGAAVVASRRPAVAGLFYPADPAECARDLDRCCSAAGSPPISGRRAVASVAPHAGWSFSGPTMAAALLPLLAARPETVILFGADHHGINPGRASLFPAGRWETPLGAVEVDGELAGALAADGTAPVDALEEAHGPEHSLEVLVPLLRARLPSARILPVITPPGAGAAAVGTAAVRAARRLGRSVVAVGSSDLTHYGGRYGFTPLGSGAEALRWSREENDREILDRALAFDPAGIESSFRRRHNACGPGAMAAVTAAARELGSDRASLLQHTTSAEVMGEGEPEAWVGYAAVAFLSRTT